MLAQYVPFLIELSFSLFSLHKAIHSLTIKEKGLDRCIVDVWKQIKKKQFAPIYLICGTDTYIMNKTKQLLIKNSLDEDTMDFNLSHYDMEEAPLESAIDDAQTLPFIGERRIILIDKPFFLTSEKKLSAPEHNVDKLEEYLQTPNPSSILVILAPYEKLDDRKKITKSLKKHAVVVEAKPVSGNQLEQWVKEQLDQYGLHLNQDAFERLLQLGGNQAWMLNQEVEKLALYAGDQKSVTAEEVELLVAKSLENNIFSFVDKVVRKDTKQSFAILHDLLKQNEEPIKIIALLASQFRVIYQAKAYAQKGYGQKQIASILGAAPFRIQIALKQSQLFKQEELYSIMQAFAQADYQMKTGKMDKELILELLLLQIHQIRNKKTAL
ncbi:MAG TPA: DNA polymerase III subunit delta [Bacillus sp. (in: firmicutes)]|uniref:DNA polymerase III subunit delta n=1 Tax=Bacillus litorisediminis TaxID=2922713 RepID=UPI001FAD4DAE|nr:DNA polymerase III subunit delta [Bacillus litorisediminis]HWO77709.1 DNA polymerase III subunit delta [Bacillus sp. (in: firmicutes)]